MKFMCLLILFPNFCEKFEVFVPWSYSLGMDAPNSLAKASDRRVRADKGSVGHGSWAKLVNKSGWVTWVMGQYP